MFSLTGSAPSEPKVPYSAGDQQVNISRCTGEVCDSVKKFLSSSNLETFVQCAKEIVKESDILTSGVLPEAYQVYGMNLLHWVVLSGDKIAIKQVIEEISPEEFKRLVNQKNDSASADSASYELLDRMCPAINSDTPLNIALFLCNKIDGFDDIADILLDRLSSGDLENLFNNTDNSVLNLAAGSCSLGIVKKLQNKLEETCFRELVDRATNPGGSTPFHHAAKGHSPDVFKYLMSLSNGNGYVSVDAGGKTAMHYIEGRISKLKSMVDEIDGLLLSSMTSPHEKEIQKWQDITSTIKKNTGGTAAILSVNAVMV